MHSVICGYRICGFNGESFDEVVMWLKGHHLSDNLRTTRGVAAGGGGGGGGQGQGAAPPPDQRSGPPEEI